MAVATEQLRVDDPETAAVLLHPTRARVLARLREPRSATEVARELGLPAPRVNHHVQRLAKAGLIRRAGSRRVRNLRETLWVALARTWVISEHLTPGGDKRRELRAESARRPLRNLVALGERLAGDALVLLDRAAWDDDEFSTFATSMDLAFPDAASRAAFLADLLEAIRALRAKYGAESPGGGEAAPEDRTTVRASGDPRGERYHAVLACYPGR
jgi:DNA-binding transcriptional ArsR family regulator